VRVVSVARKAWRAAGDPRRARREAEVLRDLVATRRAARPFRQAGPRTRSGPIALFISLTDFVHQLKVEGVLATALALRGYRPVMLTIRNARWAVPFYRAFGLEDVVDTDEFLSPERSAEADRAARRFLDGNVSVQALKALEFRGAHVGVQTLSSLSRRFLQGRISLADPQVRSALEEVLHESMRSVL
jgi:hypothetical protein